jgi:hypothetical protein
VVHSVDVAGNGLVPLSGGVMRCWAFTPPAAYRFAFRNGVQLAGPGLGTQFDSPIDAQIRQSNSIILGGNPWVSADDPPFPGLNGEGITGHPVVQTGVGPVVLRGPEADLRDAGGASGPGLRRTHRLLTGPIRLRRFDALCVITEQPTLFTSYQWTLFASFVWSELRLPAFPPTRSDFVGAV